VTTPSRRCRSSPTQYVGRGTPWVQQSRAPADPAALSPSSDRRLVGSLGWALLSPEVPSRCGDRRTRWRDNWPPATEALKQNMREHGGKGGVEVIVKTPRHTRRLLTREPGRHPPRSTAAVSRGTARWHSRSWCSLVGFRPKGFPVSRSTPPPSRCSPRRSNGCSPLGGLRPECAHASRRSQPPTRSTAQWRHRRSAAGLLSSASVPRSANWLRVP